MWRKRSAPTFHPASTVTLPVVTRQALRDPSNTHGDQRTLLRGYSVPVRVFTPAERH